MAIRQYLSTIVGTGTITDPYRPVWRDILGNTVRNAGFSQAATFSTITLENTASDVDDFYLNDTILVGTQNRYIVDYFGATRQAVVNKPWDVVPVADGYQIIKKLPDRYGQAADNERYHFWIGRLDTDNEDHALLVASPQVRYVPDTILIQTYGSLGPTAKAAVDEIFTWLNLPAADQCFATTCLMDVVLKTLVGYICWKPVEG